LAKRPELPKKNLKNFFHKKWPKSQQNSIEKSQKRSMVWQQLIAWPILAILALLGHFEAPFN
jgi:hypothetical protein